MPISTIESPPYARPAPRVADAAGAHRQSGRPRLAPWGLAIALPLAAVCAVRLWLALLPNVTAVALPSDPLWVRDFAQDYLIARATLDRQDPYEPLVALAREYLPAAVPRSLPNPTPHPPTLISFVWPLGLLSYGAAALVWLGIQALALAIVSTALASYFVRRPRRRAFIAQRGAVSARSRGRDASGRQLRSANSDPRSSSSATWGTLGGAAAGRGIRRTAAIAVGIGLLLHAWSPVAADLLQGQLMLVTAALLLAGCGAFRRGWLVAAGVLFGIATCLKLLPGLLLLFFVARREARVVASAAAVGVVALVGPLLWLGPGLIDRYLSFALPTTSAVWLGCRGNYSIFGIAARAFGGSTEVLPILDAPGLTTPIGVAVGVALVAVACWWARRGVDAEIEMATFVVVMLLVFPIAWSHYLVLLAWPLAVLGGRIVARGWARRDALLLLAVLPNLGLLPGDLAAIGAQLWGPAGGIERLPFSAALPGLIPTVGLFVVLWLLGREREAAASPTRLLREALD